jgi:hypothetical protein
MELFNVWLLVQLIIGLPLAVMMAGFVVGRKIKNGFVLNRKDSTNPKS